MTEKFDRADVRVTILCRTQIVIVNETTVTQHHNIVATALTRALALSLDRERDLEMDTETEAKNSQTRRMTAKNWQYAAWSAVRFSQ
jgi:hypothetical protein